MAQFRPFAIKPEGAPDPAGTTSIDRIVIGVQEKDYYNNYGDLNWIAGPDESIGIILAYHDTTIPLHFHSANPLELYNIGFLRAIDEGEFITLVQNLAFEGYEVNDPMEAKTALNANGWWTSYGEEPWPFGNV